MQKQLTPEQLAALIQCTVEVDGYPNYRDEKRWYLQNKCQQIIAGPFTTQQEALRSQEAK